jgi:Domain of unknown function (DUF3471)
MTRMKTLLTTTALVALCVTASAQWPNHTAPGMPKTADGKPNLSAPAPRMPDGRPDLSGVWQNGPTGLGGAPSSDPNAPPAATFFNIGANMNGGLPLRPWAADLLKQRDAEHSKDNPDAHCLPMGLLQFHEHPQPRKIVQTRDLIVVIYEANYGLRQIFLDGRPLPGNDPQPWWYGYSVGKWDGDTLVVETTGLRDGGWLDIQGSPLTDQARLTERIRRPNFGTLIVDITMDDPKAYTRPFTVRFTQDLVADGELIEFICNENERSSDHLVGNRTGQGPATFNISAQTFDRYVGRYRTAEGMVVAITRDGARFYGQMFGLPPFEIFAASEREFFLTAFDARMTFEVDGGGRATALTLDMGTKQRAVRER